MKRLLLILALLCAPAFAQSGSITSSQCVTIGAGGRAFSVGVQVTGTWSGTLQPQVSIQGQAPVNAQAATITANGVYTISVVGYDFFQVCGNTVSSGTANVFLSLNSSNGGGGGGNLSVNGNTFYASTSCGGLSNCVTWVDDDATDNCGAATTSWLALINAYSGPGSAEIFIQGSNKAFLFKTCGLSFTVNHEIFNRATLDFQETTPLANCIQEGPTGLTTWHFYSTSIDWHWHGGTLKGCTNATTAGMESMAYVNHAYLDSVNFYNFGPVASGAGLCNVAGVKMDINAEGHMSSFNVMDNRALYCFEANQGDCGSSGACLPTGGTNTMHMSDASIIDVNSNLTTSCGSVGVWEGGSHSTMDNVSIWGFDIDLRLAQTQSLTNGMGGWLVHGGTYDAAGCTANSVSAPIQVGHTGSGITQGPATLVGVEFLGGTGHATYVLAEAGDSTDTVHDFTSTGNTAFGGSTTAFPVLHDPKIMNNCTNCVAISNVLGSGASQLFPFASDTFVRANSTTTLSQGWVQASNGGAAMGINSNAATPGATGSNGVGAWYSLQSVSADQFSQASIAAYTSSANDDVGVEVRQAPNLTGFNSYEYLCFNGSRILRKYTNGTGTNISTVVAGCAVGDILRLEVRGTTLTAYHNGALDLTGTDATFTAGQPGIAIFENSSLNTDKLTNWTGGPLFPTQAGISLGLQQFAALGSTGAKATLSGTGACGTLATQSGGAWAGQVTCTGTTGASTLTITPGSTANNGWSCWANDITHTLAGTQSTASATAPVMTFSSVTASDVITFGCVAY